VPKRRSQLYFLTAKLAVHVNIINFNKLEK
jgi:hypothetical protein